MIHSSPVNERAQHGIQTSSPNGVKFFQRVVSRTKKCSDRKSSFLRETR